MVRRRFLSSPSDRFPDLADDAEARFWPGFPSARPSRQLTAHRRAQGAHQATAVLAFAFDKVAQCVLIQASHLSSTPRQCGERIKHQDHKAADESSEARVGRHRVRAQAVMLPRRLNVKLTTSDRGV